MPSLGRRVGHPGLGMHKAQKVQKVWSALSEDPERPITVGGRKVVLGVLVLLAAPGSPYRTLLTVPVSLK
jgi:hypothetical protein